MKYIKHYAIYTLGFLLCISCSNPSNELIVGIAADAPPFAFINNKGEPDGFDIELIRIIGQRMNKKVSFTVLDFNSIFPTLQTGKIDLAISSISATQERKNRFDFSAPYLFDHIAAVYKKGSPYSSPESLHDAIVGVQRGSALETWSRLIRLSSIKSLAMDNTKEIVQAIATNKVNILLVDRSEAQNLLQEDPTLGYFDVGTSQDGYAIAMKKNSEYQQRINSIIEDLQKEGILTQLSNKWLVHN